MSNTEPLIFLFLHICVTFIFANSYLLSKLLGAAGGQNIEELLVFHICGWNVHLHVHTN